MGHPNIHGRQFTKSIPKTDVDSKQLIRFLMLISATNTNMGAYTNLRVKYISRRFRG